MSAARLRMVLLLVAIATALAVGTPRVGATNADTLPARHWAYDDVILLAQNGLSTGYPDGTFWGRRELTRSDFGRALHSIIADTLRCAGEGQLWRRLHWRETPGTLRKLIREFAPELAARGVSPRAAAAGLERFEEIWHDPSPRGIRAPLPGVTSGESVLVWPEHGAFQCAGEAAARRELSEGHVCLWWLPGEREVAAAPEGIPLHPAPGTTPHERVQRMIGHNRVVWSALSQPGSPHRARWSWVADVFEPQALWRRQRTPVRDLGLAPMKLGNGHVLEPARYPICSGPMREHLLDGQFLAAPFTHSYELRVVDGPKGSEVAFVGVGRKPLTTYVLELRTATVLNVVRLNRR